MISYINKNSFATVKPFVNSTPPVFTSKFVDHLLKILESPSSPLINNEESQIRIESMILDEFDILFSDNKSKYLSGGIKRESFNLVKFAFNKFTGRILLLCALINKL